MSSCSLKSLADFQEEISQLTNQYRLEKVIGAGSYGIVIRAYDTFSDKYAAIKRVNGDIFEEFVLIKRILREIKLLNHFHHENIIGLENIFTPDEKDFSYIYIVMDIMETDLKRVLRSKQILTEEHIQFFLYQALRALHVIHSAGVLHRDITPANILINSNCDLKICDFGLAKEADEGANMTDYVTMRWYRAPELVMEHRTYTSKIDVWGVGCILGEFLGSRPLFQGKDRINQLDKMIDVLGTPSQEDLESIGSTGARSYVNRKIHCMPINWVEKFPKANPVALDLMEKMLQFNPEKRISVIECLRHPFLASLYDPHDEEVDITPFSFDEDVLKTIDDVKNVIFEEAKSFRLKQQKTSSNPSISNSNNALDPPITKMQDNVASHS